MRLRFSVGLHPQVDEGDLARLEEWIDRLGACAIGELGWDKRRSPLSLEAQTRRAEQQLELAKARGLPVVVHVVGAHGLALERLARYAPLSGVVHAYSGAAELVPRYLALGLSISFGPSVLLPSARRPLEALQRVPLERLLVETDGPDQRVDKRRGEPSDLVRVVEKIAEVRAEPFSTIAQATTDNAVRLFG